MGATEALDVLNNAKYADATKKGSATDATSLENMKASLAFLEEYLELRAQEGYTGNTYVTDYYMAIAQSNANKSAETFDHCRQYNVGENLAWGWKDPFDGWYTEEKKLYERMIRELQKPDIIKILQIAIISTLVLQSIMRSTLLVTRYFSGIQ